MSILNLEGAYENELAATGEFNPQAPKTALMLPSGQRIVLPTATLLGAVTQQTATAQEAPEAAPAAEDLGAQRTAPERTVPETTDDDRVIPLVEEQLRVGKQEIETARVRVRRETEEHVQTVNVALTDVRWEVEHVPVEQKVDAAPEIRRVGDTMIFPLVEERMVVARELWVREEVHVRRVKTVVEKSADFPVKRDVLVEERTEASSPSAATSTR